MSAQSLWVSRGVADMGHQSRLLCCPSGQFSQAVRPGESASTSSGSLCQQQDFLSIPRALCSLYSCVVGLTLRDGPGMGSGRPRALAFPFLRGHRPCIPRGHLLQGASIAASLHPTSSHPCLQACGRPGSPGYREFLAILFLPSSLPHFFFKSKLYMQKVERVEFHKV